MKKHIHYSVLITACVLITIISTSFVKVADKEKSDAEMIQQIFEEALANGKSYSNLEYLTSKIGNRLSGSMNGLKAVEWAFKAMKEAGADSVYLQECMVPHWVRGEKEVATLMLDGGKLTKPLSICALGGSIATATEGITASVIEVKNFEELVKLGKEKIKGKIVFFNFPMNAKTIDTFDAYGEAVQYRWAGASEAVKYGAVATIVRSCTFAFDDNPHTGVMGYKDTLNKIPACAVSTVGAQLLSESLKTNKDAKLYLKMSCKTLADEISFNVVGEIFGSTNSKEVILVGGHLDSWDVGEGAHDDGAGVVQSIEVIRIFKALGIKPKQTIRAVAFANEENGGRGGEKYAEWAKINKETHIAAIESDAGGFAPRGFSSEMSAEKKAKLSSWKPLFEPYSVFSFERTGSGVDIQKLKELGTPCLELLPESQRYFDYHHAATDVFKNVNKRELELGGAAMAALVWMISKNGL
jgi:carboxypeptidase Q